MNITPQRKIGEWKLAFYSMEDSQSNDAKILSELIVLAKKASSEINAISRQTPIKVAIEN